MAKKSDLALRSSLKSFLLASYHHYQSKGMSPRASIMRVSRETYESFFELLDMAEINSQGLIALEHTLGYRQFISNRGKAIVEEVKSIPEGEDEEYVEELLSEAELLSKLNDVLSEVQKFYYTQNENFEKGKRIEKKKKKK